MTDDEKRVLVLGATKGNIGMTIWQALTDRGIRADGYGRQDFDVMSPKLTEVITKLQPTHVVYSVGITELNWLQDVGQDSFEEVMRVNVGGFISVMQDLHYVRSECSVVAITSDAAWRPMRTSLLYCASKAALEMAVRVASRELASEGWRVNAVAPGTVEDTPMTHRVDQRVLELREWSNEYAEQYERNSSALGRPVTKAEVAEVVLAVLFGPAAQTGQVIAVNGGR